MCAACAPPVPVEDEPINGSDVGDKPAPTKPSKPTPSGSNSVTPTPKPSDTAQTPSPDEPSIPVPVDHEPDIDPAYPGIDVALPGATAPAGCFDGWNAENTTLSLKLDHQVFAVRLHVEDGVIHANGQACEADAQPLLAESVKFLSVKGGAEANLVILDFAIESFGSALFEEEGAFRLDGGDGDDVLYVRGSDAADHFYWGAANSRLVAAFSSFPRINLWAKSFEGLRASLGPGDDVWRSIRHLNVGLFDLDSGAVLNISGIDVPQFLWGGDGDDELNGGKFDDWLSGGAGADVLNGGDGGDRFDEGEEASGADIINGGNGLDEVSYAARTTSINVRLCRASVNDGCDASCVCEPTSGTEDEGDRVINIEIVSTGVGDDTIVGSPGDDYIYSGAGDDIIQGGAGSDVLQGGPGRDELDGGDDEDICDTSADEESTSCEI